MVQEPGDCGEYLEQMSSRKGLVGKSKRREASLAMVLRNPRWKNIDRVSMCSMLWVDRMLRRLAKMWLMVEDSWKVHATVKVLFLPPVGVHKSGESHM